MTSRSRYSKSHDWDPMQDDYNDRNYDPQYPDDEANGDVQLDHCKLYVKNISKALSEDGLRAVFEKYATKVRLFLSRDPKKRYAIVTFDSPGEAKLAMMKLNRTEPLQLNISIAHMSKNQDSQQNQAHSSRPVNQRDRSESNSSRGWNNRKQEELLEDNGLDESIDDGDLDLEGFDTESELEQVNLKLKYLELKAEQIKCKQRIILLNKAGKKTVHKSNNRCILPDGRIVVKNDGERTTDNVYSSAGGDSSLPALQRCTCTWCGAGADARCGRCGVTPYCSERCQLLDWQKRHRSVCHNLSGDKGGESRPIDQQVVLPDKAVETRVKEPQTLQTTPTLREAASPQNVKRDNSVNSNDKGNRYQYQQPVPKVNRNQTLKNYNGLRRPRVLTDNKRMQDGEEESFENNDTNDKSPQEISLQSPKLEPKPQQPIKPEPQKPKTQEPLPQKPKTQEPVPQKPKTQEPVPQEPKTQEPMPQQPKNQEKVKVPSVADTTPVKKMVPKNYVVETLPVGETIILTIDSLENKMADAYACISLHADYASEYDALCEQFGVDCEAEEPYTPQLGELFAYFNAADAAWYRARRVGAAAAALLDAARLCALPARGARLPARFSRVPEFSCALVARGVEVGDNLKCTIKSKSTDKCTVSMENMDTGSMLGDGEVSRWRPKVEGADGPVIPEVQRPDIKNNIKVYLVDCTAIDRVFVRLSDLDACKEFDAIQEDVLLYGKDASPIKENPQKGQIVIAKFKDGLWYRALCKRTNHTQNRYQLEYIEYGNIETQNKEAIYACPPSLVSRPTPVASARLHYEAATTALEEVDTSKVTMSEEAMRYLQGLRDGNVELVLTLPNGSSSPSGAEINLQIAKTKESVNKKVLELCTPEWKKLERRGADVIETPRLMLTDMTYIRIPSAACELDVFVDLASLSAGSVNARPRGGRLEEQLLSLTEKMAEYCQSELGKEPYLPAHEELCIALCPPYPQWFRAVLCDQVGGPGGSQVRLCYIDYGNLETVSVTDVRKMLPEFIKDLPALSLHVNIRGFPQNPSTEILTKALTYMNMDDEGRGTLKVTNCHEIGFGMYEADAPGLIDALK